MPRRSAADAAATRTALLDAARGVFAERGFAATTAEDIAGAAGVTRGAVSHHFGDKAGVFREVFAQMEGELNDHVVRRALEHDRPRDAFFAGARALIEFMTRPEYRQICLADAPGVLGLVSWRSIDGAIGMPTLEAGLEWLEQSGLLRVRSRPALAVLLFGALTEGANRVAVGELSQDELLDQLGQVLDGLAPPRTASKARARRG